MKQRGADEGVSENRKIKRYIEKLNNEKVILEQRQKETDKDEMLRLNRNFYGKYVEHLGRGFDIVSHNDLSNDAPQQFNPVVKAPLKPWEKLQSQRFCNSFILINV